MNIGSTSIREDISGVRVVVRDIWALFELLGESIFFRGSIITVCIEYSAQEFLTERRRASISTFDMLTR